MEASVSKRVNHVWTPNIATPHAKGIIGRCIKKIASNVSLSYSTREELFQDPPAKEECPICFLPMPLELICCVTLPDATVKSVPIYNFGKANEGLQGRTMETYFYVAVSTFSFAEGV
jgi:hypothetical protein